MIFEFLLIISVFCVIEVLFYVIIVFVNKKFPWLIISKDEKPVLSKDGLAKFIPKGYDPELGWIRKPNTSDFEAGKYGKVRWKINSRGSRFNPNFEEFDSKISCYGDSFVFCRQVNDDETWEHYLSKKINTNVTNFGVGNYGLDQALLRLKREYPSNRTPVVILGVVPDTISRVLSSWKHYYEYGNTFAFKPRFILKNGELYLIKNYIDDETKFEKYVELLPLIRTTDFFYRNKFKKEIIGLPYSITVFKNPRRNFSLIFWIIIIELYKKIGKSTKKIEWNPMKTIMRINLRWRIKLYECTDAISLLERIVNEYSVYARQNNFKPILVILPQKDDVNFIKNKFHFYRKFIKNITMIYNLHVIDIGEKLIHESNLDDLYSDQNEYGGHFSKTGNEKVAKIIYDELKNLNLI